MRRMTQYEVRVTQTHVDYYRIVADSEEHAKDMIRKRVTGDKVTYGFKEHTILREPIINYAVQLSAEGEPIL